MKRIITSALAVLTAASTVSLYAADNNQAAAANVSPAERAKIEAVVHEYLVTKPEVLMEAMQVLQRRQYEQAEQTVKKTQQSASSFANELFHQSGDPVIGNPKGTVTITEFFDYQCPHCVDMAPVIDAIIKANSNVRFIFKEFPIRGPMSEVASRAALAANMQGKYYPLHEAILTAQPPLTQDAIYQLAKANGLDVDKLKKDMNSKQVTDAIKATTELAQKLKLFGTPAFFFGKTDATTGLVYVPGQMDQAQMQKMIDQVK